MPAPIVVVIGSINMDLVVRTRVMPRPGETVLGDEFVTVPGGKGANQAVAAAKLAGRGTEVHMVGRVGGDAFGQQLLDGLRENGVRTEHVTVTANSASGVAMILVDRKGENSIVVAPGANAKLSPPDVDAAQDVIRRAAAVVLQLEIPLETVRHAVALCQHLGVFTILDPAPVPPKAFPRALFGVDLITPNQTEAEMLIGQGTGPGRPGTRVADAKQIAGELLSRGSRAVALKLGRRGSVFVDGNGGFRTAKPFKVDVVDTTAAGDAFTGALAVARAEEMVIADTMQFANAAGALCCAAFGAQPALPTRDAVERLIETRGV